MNKDVKEPIKVRWIWPVIVLISLLTIPFFFKVGSFEPIILGLPLWFLVSLFSSIALAIFLGFVIDRFWHMESLIGDEQEELSEGEVK